jgi:hypothetical protein
MDGSVVQYDSYSRPYLISEQQMARLAQGQTVSGWYVFEIPDANQSDCLLVSYDQYEPTKELFLP